MKQWLSAILAATVLAGCVSLDPTYHRPIAPTPASFPSGRAYPTLDDQAASPGRWREVFVDAKLKAVIELALANNRDLRVALANIRAARAQHQIQRAALFPSLTGQFGATYSQTPITALGIPGSGDISEHQYAASGNVSAYEVDLFGRLQSLSRAAFDQYLASEQARRAAQISLIAEVANDDLTLGADRQLLAISRQTLTSGQAALDLTQSRLAGGIASGLDVSQARTIVEQARSDVAVYTAQVEQDRNALDLVVGTSVDDALLPSGVDGPPVMLTELPSISSAVLVQRPDVLEAEDQLKADNADIGAARAAFLPQITLTASGGVSSPALSSLFEGPAALWSFAPTITQPIFDAGKVLGGLSYAKATRDADLARYEKAVQTAFREVADALAVRGQIGARVAAQQALVDASAEALRLSTARYQRGADTYLNELIAQRSLYAAQQGLASAQLARSANLVNLYKALGGGVD